MSKLASIETIKTIEKHPNADALDIATVLGYRCIVGRDSFSVGEKVVLIQPDTVLPDEPWAELFRKRSNRVKACRLRGEWSFGIVMSIDSLPKVKIYGYDHPDGSEVSEIIGVTKYEPPAPQDLSAAGYLPRGLPKTDEERWQNFDKLPYGEKCDITLKIDGSSMTVYARKTSPESDTWECGITSRTLSLKPDCENKYTLGAAKYDILNKLRDFCQKHDVSLALRGELYGNGIQGFDKNPHAKLPLDFAAFNVYNLDTLKYEGPDSPFYYEKVATELGIPTVPMLERDVIFSPEHVEKYSVGVETINGKPFEGVVVKFNDDSLKIINLKYDERK